MHRRTFLVHTTAISTGAIVSPSLFARTTAQKPLILKSLKYGMIKEELSLLDKFKLVKDLGFDGIELDSPYDLDDREVLKAQEQTELQIPGLVNSLHWGSALSDPDPKVRTRCTTSMIEAFDRCKLFGGTTVLLVPAVVNKQVSYADAWERSTAEIHKMLPAAASTGIKIAIENVWNNFLLSPLEAARFIDQFDSDMIGWYMDVGNIIRYGWPEHWIKTLAHRILKIDVKEYSRTKQKDEGIWAGFDVKIGDGDCDWASVNQALADVGYSGWGSAEVPGGDRKRLREISDRMDAVYQL